MNVIENLNNKEHCWKTTNEQYLKKIQKFLDIVDNVSDEKLRKRIIIEMLKCDETVTKLAEEEFKNKLNIE